MRFTLALVGALCAWATAAPQAQADAAPKKSTLTYTATSTVTTRPTITSGGTTTITSTTSTLRSGPDAAPVYIYTSTTTTTSTINATAYTTLPAKTTVTVATPNKFTPILSESFFADDVSISYKTVTATSPVYLHPAGTSYVLFTTSYHSTTLTPTSRQVSTSYTGTTSTTTVTRSSATITSHAACATNNFANKVPTGETIGFVNGTSILYTPFPEVGSAVDCCEACFATPDCVGGVWSPDISGYFCEIFVLNKDRGQTCDPIKQYMTFEHTMYDGPNTIFNGACAQYAWDFEAKDYNRG